MSERQPITEHPAYSLAARNIELRREVDRKDAEIRRLERKLADCKAHDKEAVAMLNAAEADIKGLAENLTAEREKAERFQSHYCCEYLDGECAEVRHCLMDPGD